MAHRADESELICVADILRAVGSQDEEMAGKLTVAAARYMAKRRPHPDRPDGGSAPPRKDKTWLEDGKEEPPQSGDGDSGGDTSAKSDVDEMLEADALAIEARRLRVRARSGRG